MSEDTALSPYDFDRQFGASQLCGVDEAGRGPLVGPVVAGCVHIPDGVIEEFPELLEIADSKVLAKPKREELYDLITAHCHFGCGQASLEEIEDINILHASMKAMTRAYLDMLEHAPNLAIDLVLVDGNRIPKDMPIDANAIIKGDA